MIETWFLEIFGPGISFIMAVFIWILMLTLAAVIMIKTASWVIGDDD